jgi:hypothetical protein
MSILSRLVLTSAAMMIGATAHASTISSTVAVQVTGIEPYNTFSQAGPAAFSVVDADAGTLKFSVGSDGFSDNIGGLTTQEGRVGAAFSAFVANTGDTAVTLDTGAIKIDFDADFLFSALPGVDLLHVNAFHSVNLFECNEISFVGCGDFIGSDSLFVNYSELGTLFGPNNSNASGGFSFSKNDGTGYIGTYEIPSFTLESGHTLAFDYIIQANAAVGTNSATLPIGYETAAFVDGLNTSALSIDLPDGVALDLAATPGFSPTFVTSNTVSPVPLPASLPLLAGGILAVGWAVRRKT